MSITITLKKTKDNFKSVISKWQSFEASEAQVGIFNETYDDGLSVAQVAFWQDLGVPQSPTFAGIPSRPFMTVGLAELIKKQSNLKFFATQLHKFACGKTTKDALLSSLGNKLSTELKVVVDAWMNPPNAPSTIARKGDRNDPLVDTGKMRDSISNRVAASRKFKKVR